MLKENSNTKKEIKDFYTKYKVGDEVVFNHEGENYSGIVSSVYFHADGYLIYSIRSGGLHFHRDENGIHSLHQKELDDVWKWLNFVQLEEESDTGVIAKPEALTEEEKEQLFMWIDFCDCDKYFKRKMNNMDTLFDFKNGKFYLNGAIFPAFAGP